MVRPNRCRLVEKVPDHTYFKPQGIALRVLNEVVVSVEEYEALRLKDYELISEIEASQKMDISQPTFNRLYVSAKQKIIKALVEGLAIKIDGGNYKMPNKDGTGPQGLGPKTGRGMGNCAPTTNIPAENQNPNFVRMGNGLGRGNNSRGRRINRDQNSN